MYKYDLHVHTSDVSFCGHLPASETVQRYIDAGYSGICITDHYTSMFFESEPGSWHELADKFLAGFRNARDAAHGRLDVILGAEFRFLDYNINDYLIYGITEEFIHSFPELYKLTLPEFFDVAKRHNLLIIQAHPMRNKIERIHLDLLDGMEVYNAHPEHDSRNEETARFVRGRNYILTSGSDCHRSHHVGRGGILSKNRIANSAELVSVLRSGEYELIAPFDPKAV